MSSEMALSSNMFGDKCCNVSGEERRGGGGEGEERGGTGERGGEEGRGGEERRGEERGRGRERGVQGGKERARWQGGHAHSRICSIWGHAH